MLPGRQSARDSYRSSEERSGRRAVADQAAAGKDRPRVRCSNHHGLLCSKRIPAQGPMLPPTTWSTMRLATRTPIRQGSTHQHHRLRLRFLVSGMASHGPNRASSIAGCTRFGYCGLRTTQTTVWSFPSKRYTGQADHARNRAAHAGEVAASSAGRSRSRRPSMIRSCSSSGSARLSACS